MKPATIERAYQLARERYAELGVDTEKAMRRLAKTPVSLHCWQGDDVGGFESGGGGAGGGTMATGNYPGKARTPDELRGDAEKAFSLIPGRHRFNLHSLYAETGRRKVSRNELQPRDFANWIDWAKANKLGLDFNPSFFSHPMAADGLTLSHPDAGVRRFWIEHGIACRRIGAAMGKALGTPCVTNVWIPDGMKDVPADRKSPRERLERALDELFAQPINPKHNLDAIEGKLFGIGAESYTVGSHEFYLGYAVRHAKLLCLDAGHFHPTETIADKLSAVLPFVPEVLLHVSRGVRWDSDHVVILNDELRSIAEELVRGDYLDRVHIGLDFFDASINRVAAWVIGTRNMIKALLIAMLEPYGELKRLERDRNFTARLALLEELKTLPFAAVWDFYCLKHAVPAGTAWMSDVETYEKNVLSQRS